MQNLFIISFDVAYLDEIIACSDEAFGTGYVSKNDIKNNAHHFAFITLINNQFAGYCLGYKCQPLSINSLLNYDIPELPLNIFQADQDGTLGVIKTIVVKKEYRQQGIANKIVKYAEKVLKEKNTNKIIVAVWSVNGKAPLQNVLYKNNYADWLENNEYWKEPCEAGSFDCVSFNGSCNCSVKFFTKSI